MDVNINDRQEWLRQMQGLHPIHYRFGDTFIGAITFVLLTVGPMVDLGKIITKSLGLE